MLAAIELSHGRDRRRLIFTRCNPLAGAFNYRMDIDICAFHPSERFVPFVCSLDLGFLVRRTIRRIHPNSTETQEPNGAKTRVPRCVVENKQGFTTPPVGGSRNTIGESFTLTKLYTSGFYTVHPPLPRQFILIFTAGRSRPHKSRNAVVPFAKYPIL